MQSESCVEFPPFRLDLANQELWRGAARVPLRGKPFAVLAYLATHPGRLVPRAELVRAVWVDTHVGDDVLRGYVRDLRAALGDDSSAPRFIETVARRGYRFVAPIRSPGDGAGAGVAPGGGAEPAPANVVGRKAEFHELERRLAAAAAAERQLVFVTGEAGIGKTTLADAFLRAARNRRIRTARGQCLEHFGVGEPYLPLLEALGRLCRLPGGHEVVAVLARHAPTWLVEMPALVPDAELETVRRRVQGATRERMLREFAEAVEVLTAAAPLVLVLEDLHWSDRSTLDVLSSLARRREPARLFVLGTYRPAGVGRAQPLGRIKQELQVHGLCAEIVLPPLDAEDVAEYLVARFPRAPLAPHLGRAVHQKTEGNPLFVVSLVDSWTASARELEGDAGWLEARLRAGEGGMPDTLRQMIVQEIDRLPAEARRVLGAASVAGAEFSTATVAGALEAPEEEVEERCEELAERGSFLRSRGVDTGPGGAVAGRYAFAHALHRQVLYEGLPAARRTRLHRRIGTWSEGAWGPLVHEHAAELAMHFEKGRDPERASHHLAVAAGSAMRKHAYHEAAALARTALEALAGLPEGEDRQRRELSLQLTLGAALLTTEGYAAPEVQQAYARAHALSRCIEQAPELPFALAGLFRFYLLRAEYQRARELAGQVLRLAEAHDRSLLPVAHALVGISLLSLADFAAARAHLEQALALYDFERHRSLGAEHGDDPALTSLAFLAITLWTLGEPDTALARIREALALAERLASPYGVAFAHDFAAWVHARRGEPGPAQACSEVVTRVAAEHGFRFLLAEAAIYRGWALVQQGSIEPGLAELEQGFEAHRATGTRGGLPAHLALLAEAYGRAGRPADGLGVVSDALAIIDATSDRSFEAELHRLEGELRAQGAEHTGAKQGRAEAHDCLERAIGIARRQGARSFELRALLSLVRLEGGRRRDGRARGRLRELADSFTEGFDTADLRAARTLLDALASPGA